MRLVKHTMLLDAERGWRNGRSNFQLVWKGGKKIIFREMRNIFQPMAPGVADEESRQGLKINIFTTGGREGKIGWFVLRVRSSVPDTPWRMTEATVVGFIPCHHNFRESFHPDGPWKISFLPRRSLLPIFRPDTVGRSRAKISRFSMRPVFF